MKRPGPANCAAQTPHRGLRGKTRNSEAITPPKPVSWSFQATSQSSGFRGSSARRPALRRSALTPAGPSSRMGKGGGTAPATVASRRTWLLREDPVGRPGVGAGSERYEPATAVVGEDVGALDGLALE